MSYIPRTPFKRAVDAALVKQLALADQGGTHRKVSKWDVLGDLSVAKQHYGLTDRSLTVLQALLSFHPETDLADTGAPIVVFPSNAALCERLHGMACSTMRRHLARLVSAGLVLRRDSPNGKRFVKRRSAVPEAFGLDLAPLPRLAEGIRVQADVIRSELAEIHRVRRSLILMRRDLDAFATYGREVAPDALPWDALSDLSILTARDMRRKLGLCELRDIEAKLQEALDRVDEALIKPETAEMGINPSQIEQHHQNSDKEDELLEKLGYAPLPDLGFILAACSEISLYYEGKIKNWSDLHNAADAVAPMMGIDKPTWFTAVNTMGPQQASIVVAAMLERFSTIRNSGAYLRRLTSKSKVGEFTCLPMLTALKKGSERSDATGSQL